MHPRAIWSPHSKVRADLKVRPYVSVPQLRPWVSVPRVRPRVPVLKGRPRILEKDPEARPSERPREYCLPARQCEARSGGGSFTRR